MMDDVPVTEGNKNVIYGDDEQAAIALDIRAPADADNEPLTVTIDTVPAVSVGTILLDGQAIAGGTTLSVAQLGRLQFVPGFSGQPGSLTYTVSDSGGGAATSTVALEQFATTQNSATLGFDDPLLPVTAPGQPPVSIPNGYGATGDFAGFVWNHMGIVSDPPYPNPSSAPNVAYGDSAPSTISAVDGSEFVVNSLEVGRLVGATQITLIGYDFGRVVGQATYALPGGDFSGVWDLVQPNFGAITSLVIESNTGDWKMDDFSSTSAPIYMGGFGNDVLVGSGQGDRFYGGGGNDAITGNAGTDTAIYSGNRINYNITYNAGTQTFTIADQRAGSPDGVDTVSGVELFQFADQTVSAAALIGAPPTDEIWPGGTVAENAPNGTVVGTVSGIDPDPLEALRYSLTNDDGGRFAIDARTGTLTVANGSLLDHASGTVQTITVRVTDHAGFTFDKNFAIGVTGATPTLSVQNASGNAGSAIALSIATALGEPDGESLSINITGLPSGATLSAGTHNADGSWTLTPAQLSNLSLTVSAGSFAGAANLMVTSTATATDGSTAASAASLAVLVAGTVSTHDSLNRLSSVLVVSIDGTQSLTNYDTTGSQPWTTQIFAYNSTGGLASLTVNNDDDSRSVASYDVTNSQPWSSEISVYDSASNLISLTVDNDDGTQSVTSYDAANSETWTTQVFAYDSTGALTSQTVNNDDGTRSVTNYDVTNSQPWASEIAVYNSSNVITSLTVINDDFTMLVTNYDVTNSEPWISQVLAFDMFFNLTSITTNNDDGTQTGSNSDGSRWSTMYDLVNAYSWSSFRIDYDASGNMTSQTVVNDDLARVVNAYNPASGAWTSTTVYNSAGQVESQAGTNSDGTHFLTAYDTANAYSWATFTNIYVTATDSQNWTFLSQTGTNDDGTHNLNAAQVTTALDTLTWYSSPYLPVPDLAPQTGTNADGTTWSTITDAKDVYGWFTITKHYDATGVLSSLNGTDDGGSSWANVYGADGSWSTSLYDASGNLFTQSGTNPDGTHWITAHDLNNQYVWSTFTNTYDANWGLTSQTETNHDGTHTVNAGAIASALDVLPWYASPYDPTPTAAPSSGAPTLSVQNASGNAGSAIALSIATAPAHTQDVLSVRITGVPSGATLSAGTRNADGSWTLTPAQLSNLNLTAPAGSFAGLANLTVASTATEVDGSAESSSANLQIVIAGVATAPTLSVQISSGNAGSAIALSIATALTATDGQETLSVKIAGLPPGATLSAGTHNSDGSWTLTSSQLANLKLMTAAATSFDGIANLTVTSTATETDGSAASRSAALKVIVAGSVSTHDSLDRLTSVTTVNLDATKSVTNYDVTNSQPWTSQIFAYDSGGNLTSVTTNNDDGTQTGVRPDGSHWSTIFDLANAYNWLSYRLDYDAAGDMTSQTIVNDNLLRVLGSVVNAYNPANGAWTSTTVYDAAGQVESQAGTNSDGMHFLTAYDTANAYSWATFTNIYTATTDETNWTFVSQTGTNDDGTHNLDEGEVGTALDTLTWYSSPYLPIPSLTPVTTTHADGTSSSILTDGSNAYGWNTITKNYTASGVLSSLNGTNDSGSSWTNTYGAASSWTVIVRDASGNVVTQSGANTDGTHWVTANDVNNQYGWATFTNTYNSNWVLTSQTETNHDGTHTVDTGAIASALDVLTWYASPYDPTPTSPPAGGGGDGLPVILDLGGNGVNISPLGVSTATFDMAGDGRRVATAWAGADDALLAIDLGGSGIIDQAKQIEFTQWAPGATSDMQALRQVFDTNHDGELDPGDALWKQFRVWNDANGNGVSDPGEVATLDQLGITSIDLNPVGPSQRFADGSVINGLTTFTRGDGTIGVAADTSLAYGSATSPSAIASNSASAINSQFNQLIQAMATYSIDNAGLDAMTSVNARLPEQAPPMIASSWH
jgi:hypothetical protein